MADTNSLMYDLIREEGYIVRFALGEPIKELTLHSDRLVIRTNLHSFQLRDPKQCCEERYFTTGDDLQYFIGARFYGASMRIVYVPDDELETGADRYEIGFLIVKTDRGEFTIEAHNNHNGYYSGFGIVAEEISG